MKGRGASYLIKGIIMAMGRSSVKIAEMADDHR
jgi:hypothetical protein